MSLEQWLPIPGFPDYEVSDEGRVRSWKLRRPVILSPTLNPYGYPRVGLRVEDRQFTKTVHRLVLLAFVGPPPDGMCACHNDSNRTNNALGNLRWDTFKGNTADWRRDTWRPKTACPRGHDYTPENTYINPFNAGRNCRICMRDTAARYRARRRAAA